MPPYSCVLKVGNSLPTCGQTTSIECVKLWQIRDHWWQKVRIHTIIDYKNSIPIAEPINGYLDPILQDFSWNSL